MSLSMNQSSVNHTDPPGGHVKSNRAGDMSMRMVQKHWSECCISEQGKHFLTLSNKGCEMLCS